MYLSRWLFLLLFEYFAKKMAMTLIIWQRWSSLHHSPQLQEWPRCKKKSCKNGRAQNSRHFPRSKFRSFSTNQSCVLSPQIKVNLFHGFKVNCSILLGRRLMQLMTWKIFLKVSVAACVRISKLSNRQ